MSILLIIIGFLLILLLVILHEYGHFLVAKRNGVEVEEFGIGFPPRLWGKTMGKGIFRGYYSLNLLPIGGFVRLKGENDEAKGENTYGSKSLYVKAKILLAGVGVNFLIAIVLFTIVSLIGIPRFLPAEPHFAEEQFSISSDTHIISSQVFIGGIVEDSLADQIDLRQGDEIVSITDHHGQITAIDSSDNLSDELQTLVTGEEISLTIARGDNTYNKSVELGDDRQLGVSTSDLVIYRNTWSAPISGVMLSLQFSKVTLQGLGIVIVALFQGDFQTAGDSVGGPISIYFILEAASSFGINLILMIIALISLTLAIVNSLPIPALDGGRLALTVFFRKILRKTLTKNIESRIVGASMVFLLTLMVIITLADIGKYF